MNPIPAFLIAYSDSSFTNPHEVVLATDPEERTGKFTHMGAMYWGFETERHKATSITDSGNTFRFDHDAYHWLHIGLKQPAKVSKITVSTKWFTGNQVPEIAIELVNDHSTTEVIARTKLEPDSEHEFDIPGTLASECLVRCYHEGGIARINLFGETTDDETQKDNLLERATISHISNEHYGSPVDAVNGRRQVDYMFGWESARTGFGESALFHLAKPAVINEIIVDTYLHRLNPPLSCHVFGLQAQGLDNIEQCMTAKPRWAIVFDDGLSVMPDDFTAYMQAKQYLDEPTANARTFTIQLRNEHNNIWKPLVSFGQLRPDTWHRFQEIEFTEPVTHILYMHYPNGGIHGLQLYGEEI